MGTWGTGPLDSDDALDLVDLIALDPDRYAALITVRLMALLNALFENDPDDLAEDMQAALASCAVVADVRHGEHFYTSAPDPDDPEGFRVESVARDEGLEDLARKALAQYQKLEREVIDLGWDDASSYQEHRAHLSELERRLST